MSLDSSTDSFSTVGEARFETETHNKQQPRKSWGDTPAFSYRKNRFSKQLASLSINKLNFSSVGLHGRQHETKLLFDALARLVDPTHKSREIVLIHGASGTGKSKLAEQLRSPSRTVSDGTIYASGKFAARQQEMPYSVIASVCQGLCDQILRHPKDENINEQRRASSKQIRKNLRHELGSEAQTLFPIIPQLRAILQPSLVEEDDDIASDSSNFADSKRQFDLALRRFIHAIGKVLPVSILLDDIQWADQASLALMETLLTDRDTHCLLIVATYRTSEVNEKHAVTKMITNIKAASQEQAIGISRLRVDNLTVTDVTSMLVDLLSSEDNAAGTSELAALVHRKTAGNAYFVKVYLNSLVKKELLKFNFGLMNWSWSINNIEAQTRVSKNVVDVLNEKINRIADDVRRGLLLAACLGPTFDRKVLTLVMGALLDDEVLLPVIKEHAIKSVPTARIHTTIDEWLTLCKEEGLIELCDNTSSFRWAHDKVQESTLQLVTKEQQANIKFKVARLLVKDSNSSILEENLFVAVNHLNDKSGEFSLQESKSLGISELNLRAGEKAIASSAFATAADYLRTGIAFLRQDSWQNQYDLTLQLYTLAAKAENSCGDFDHMESHCSTILLKAHNKDKFPIYPIFVDAIGHKYGAQKAVDTTFGILSDLGCHFPKRFRLLHTIVGLIHLKMTTHKLQPDDISALSYMSDQYRLQTMKLLESVYGWVIIAKSDALPLVSFKSFNWTIQYGLHDSAPIAMTLASLTLGVGLGDSQGRRKYALLGLKLSDDMGQSKKYKARVYFNAYGIALPATQTFSSCMPPLLDAYKMSLECGDSSVSMWSIYMYLEFSMYAGRKLEEIDAGYREHIWKMKEANLMQPYNFSQILWQGILNLMGQSRDPLVLTGEAMDEKSFVKDNPDTSRDAESIAIVNSHRMYLACLFSNHKRAAKIAMTAGGAYPAHFPGIMRYRFLSALSCASMARTTKKHKYKRHLNLLSRTIKKWVKAKNPNVIHCDMLIDAELAALRGNHGVARQQFEAAIRLTARSGLIHDHALANERFGEFLYHSLEDRIEAAYRIEEAIRLFIEWGAISKAAALEKVWASILRTGRFM